MVITLQYVKLFKSINVNLDGNTCFLEEVLFGILNQWMKYPINRSLLYASESFSFLKMAFCPIADVKFYTQWQLPFLPEFPEMKSCKYH